MATTIDGLREKRSVPGPIYVFNSGVRAWHWIHALSILVLAGTGYFIANPRPAIASSWATCE